MSLSRRSLLGFVAGLPLALKWGAVAQPFRPGFKRPGLSLYRGVPIQYEKAIDGPLWHMSSVGNPTDWDRLPR